jgi:hypothetical protein
MVKGVPTIIILMIMRKVRYPGGTLAEFVGDEVVTQPGQRN